MTLYKINITNETGYIHYTMKLFSSASFRILFVSSSRSSPNYWHLCHPVFVYNIRRTYGSLTYTQCSLGVPSMYSCLRALRKWHDMFIYNQISLWFYLCHMLCY